ncbi:MAG: hypothetical protein Q9N34_08375 [Aquificota bacterium]|nr:hypothetical protein [Aquificota bacterium]
MLEADVLRAVQEHIPIRKEPFRAIAEELGSDEETVLSVLKT